MQFELRESGPSAINQNFNDQPHTLRSTHKRKRTTTVTAFPKISKNLSRRGFIGASALASAALMLQAGEAHAPASTRAQLAAVYSGSPAHQLLYKTDEFFIAHRGAGNISPEHPPMLTQSP